MAQSQVFDIRSINPKINSERIIAQLLRVKDRLNLENLKHFTYSIDNINLINNGKPLFDEQDHIVDEHINIIVIILGLMEIYLSNMNGIDIINIFNNIEIKYPQLMMPSLISDENINNIITRTVTIGENGRDLKFVFDIETPAFGIRDVATVYTLKINNENKLSKKFKYTQLYKSSGTSRGIGGEHQGVAMDYVDKWLPYDGFEDNRISKLEDIYYIKTREILYSELPDERFIETINYILNFAPDILVYKRYILEDYAIASYLLNKYNYVVPEKISKLYVSQHKKEAEGIKIANLRKSLFSLIPQDRVTKDDRTNSKFYYEKYLKYKQKYFDLKK